MKCQKLNSAINIAVGAHFGQYDKAGLPYILHPIRVSEAFVEETHKVVAVLHDIVEDTNVTIDEIYDCFGQVVGDAVKAITKLKGENYYDYLDRVRDNDVAFEVKLADMADNSSKQRLEHLDLNTRNYLAKKYTKGIHYLLTGERK